MATASAATTCAHRPPPSSRAIRPARSIAAPWANAANSRRPSERRAEKLEGHAGEGRRQGRIGDVAPGQMAGIVERGQLVAVKTVLAVGERVQDDARERQQQ